MKLRTFDPRDCVVDRLNHTHRAPCQKLCGSNANVVKYQLFVKDREIRTLKNLLYMCSEGPHHIGGRRSQPPPETRVWRPQPPSPTHTHTQTRTRTLIVFCLCKQKTSPQSLAGSIDDMTTIKLWGADPDSYRSTGAYIFLLAGAALFMEGQSQQHCAPKLSRKRVRRGI
jgi:hypothetical protein